MESVQDPWLGSVPRDGRPAGTDGTKVSAAFKDGVLNVHVPKNPGAKPKSINIKVS